MDGCRNCSTIVAVGTPLTLGALVWGVAERIIATKTFSPTMSKTRRQNLDDSGGSLIVLGFIFAAATVVGTRLAKGSST
jgi:hypothetical protein